MISFATGFTENWDLTVQVFFDKTKLHVELKWYSFCDESKLIYWVWSRVFSMAQSFSDSWPIKYWVLFFSMSLATSDFPWFVVATHDHRYIAPPAIVSVYRFTRLLFSSVAFNVIIAWSLPSILASFPYHHTAPS